MFSISLARRIAAPAAGNGSTLITFSSASDEALFAWGVCTTGANASNMVNVAGGVLIANATGDGARVNGSLLSETSTSFSQSMDFVLGSGGKLGLHYGTWWDASPDRSGGILMWVNGTVLWLNCYETDGLEKDYFEVDTDSDPLTAGSVTYNMRMNVTTNGTGVDVNGSIVTLNGTMKHQVSGHYSTTVNWTTNKGIHLCRIGNNHSVDNYKVVPAE